MHSAVRARANQHLIDTLEPDRMVLEDTGHRVSSLEDVAIAKHDENSLRKVPNEMCGRFEHEHQR